ncbi:S41 family peptidase [Lichenicola sp.]|uniref:S41 family peptidase n=1 Tax=Lichenicola sp. TaxID=2804529 RepID=UPI003B000F33
MTNTIRCRLALLMGLLSATALSTGTALAQGAAPAVPPTLMRFPNSHGDRIVFVAHGNLWTVSKSGGTAQRLTADPGQDLMPRYSPDGQWIAFTASYQGNQDVYVIPAGGGVARRLTFHSDVVAKAPTRWGPDNMVVTWTPDSKNIVFMSRRMDWNPSVHRVFQVPVAGGLPTPLPLDRAGLLTYGPDGHSIAYTRIFRDFRTWKRYDGGRAPDVYTYDFNSKQLVRITDFKGNDTSPMWYGRKIYFLSDRDAARRANIWVYDLDSKQFTQVTHFTNYDVDFPSLGVSAGAAATITFQQGGKLWSIDLPSQQLHEVTVSVPDDGTRTQTRWTKVADAIRATDTSQNVDYALSPNGARAAFSARGDLFTVPAEHGAIRDLTNTSNADEDHPAWSPDGRTIAYTTDIGGSQQIAVRPAVPGQPMTQATGQSPGQTAGMPAAGERLITHFRTGFYYTPVWSPDGRTLAVPDGNHNLWLVTTDGSEPRLVASNTYNEIHDAAFSPDGKWLAFSTQRPNQMQAIHLYEIAVGQDTIVSSPMNSDFDPSFSPDGKLLLFVSSRHELPTFSDDEQNVAALKSNGIYAATLSATAASPFAPQSDEGIVDTIATPAAPPAHAAPGHTTSAHADAAKGDAKPWQPGLSAPIHIDFDGLMQRAVPVPIEPADITAMDTRGSRIFYQTQSPPLIEGNLPGEKSALHVYDLTTRKDAIVVEGLDNYALSADGTKVLYKQDKEWHVIEAKPGHSNDKTLALDAMRARIEPTQEWAEMFENAWRLDRDLFYSAVMNGNDWQAVHDKYVKLLPLVGTREDLNYLIGQIQGEIGNSHTYVGGGDDGNPTDAVSTPLLGVDYALDSASGRYRFAKIYPGDNTRKRYRSPLTEPGVNVHEGDYLLAVNGQQLKAPADPESLFVGLQGPVTLTVSASATATPRDVTVDPIPNELAVREQYWIDHNRQKVDKLSGGRVGYIYLSDMESLGMEQFMRQFYPQIDKQALVIDDRWNNGGFIDQMVLERLRRVLIGMSTNRERAAMTIPRQLVDGPKVTLMNHYSASDGDIFPYYFRKYGLGKLVGTRTWGGVRGIRGEWTMLDGGYITVPEDSLYGTDSQWIIENHGVDPDVEVEDVPSEYQTDHDIQLETGVKLLTDQLGQTPHGVPAPPPLLPAYPKDGQVPPMSH